MTPYAPPPVYVPAPTPRRLRLGSVVAGPTRFYLTFGAALAAFGSILTVAVLDPSARGDTGKMAIATTVCAAIGAAFVVAGVAGAWKRGRLYRSGTLAVGRVTSVEPTGTRIGNRQVLRTHYEFPGPDGPVEGSATHTHAPPVGAEVSVLFDPADPEKSILPLPGAFGFPGEEAPRPTSVGAG